ncbi:MAG TPA: phosphoglycerate mutase, partial [Acidimicrobiia bacterium]|nr:phosphoglycerate mutase [Acidimicrobiia bacterium]
MDVTPLVRDAGTKIVLVVMDGLGGFADADHGTELEEADTPNLDRLAAEGCTGLGEPVGPGITPGSGPGHLALFGYDPEVFELGRGALSAAGLEFPLGPGDVAARGNLCTLDSAGHITDRRAGRLPDPEARAVVQLLSDKVHLDGADVIFRHEREHRVLVVLRGEGLDPRITDTDPQAVGVAPLPPRALDPAAERTAALVAELDAQVRACLSDQPKANGL